MLRTHAINEFTNQANAELLNSYYNITVTPGNGSKGAWVQLLSVDSSNPIATQDSFGMLVRVFGNTAVTSRPAWFDLGYDPAGGTAYQVVVPDFQAGGGSLTTYPTMGRGFHFPMYFKAGGTLAIRCQSVNTSTFRVGAQVYLAPSHPGNIWVAKYSETIGTTTGSLGTSLTLGNAAKGAWASLGTTTRALQYFQLGIHCNNTVVTSLSQLFDLAYGDGTNFQPIISNFRVGSVVNEEFYSPVMPPELCFRDVPAGSTLYIRGGSSAAPDTGWHASATGFGG